MGEKIARITKDKELMLKGEIVEYPSELEGGRNYFSLTHLSQIEVKVWPSWSGGSSKTYYFNLLPNTDYTISTNLPSGHNVVYYDGSSVSNRDFCEGVSLTKKTDSTGEVFVMVIPGRDYYDEVLSGDYWVKLEKGNIPTPWTPAPEDLGLDYPDNIQNFKTKFLSDGTMLVPELIENNDGTFSFFDTDVQVAELIEDVSFGGDA